MANKELDAPEIRAAAYKYSLKLAKGEPKRALQYYKQLIETANQESWFGSHPKTKGGNVMQVDPGTRKDLVNRYSDTMAEWGVDANSPLDQNMALAALKYKDRKIDKAKLDTPAQRAKFWKDNYNTRAGKGTPEQYLGTNKNIDFSGVEKWWEVKHGSN
jgi:hypothetical protein